MVADLQAVLAELEASGQRRLAVARSLLGFLQRDCSERLDEITMLRWMNESLSHGAYLESTLVRLTFVDKVVAVLADRGLADRDLIKRLRKRPDLLEHLSGGRPKVPGPWQPVMADFEKSLRGLAPLHQARCLQNAARFIEALGQQHSPDETSFLCWLDLELLRCTLRKVFFSFPQVERFCQFLRDCGHPCNPAHQWRCRHKSLEQALRCRKAGQVSPLREPRYQSFLAPHIEAYIAFKRGLGRKYSAVAYVDSLGKFAQEQGMGEVEQIDHTMVLAFLSSRSWQKSTRGEAQKTLAGFFRFLVRSRLIPVDKNPTDRLPRVRRPPRPPYIFSVREISEILDELKKAPTHVFNQRLYFTMVLLIYSCGLRRREAIHLQVGDVDLNNAAIFIRCTKFGKDRRIPIGPRVCEQLTEYHQNRVTRLGQPGTDTHFFAQATGNPVWSGTLLFLFREACARARIGSVSLPKPRLHDLRHTFAVHRLYKWYLEGADPESRLPLLSIYMGHVHGESTRHYLNLGHDLLRIAARPMERRLESWFQDNPGELDES